MLRSAPRSNQEQQHEEAGSQDPAGDPAEGREQQGAGETGGAGSQPGLCHSHWLGLLLWLTYRLTILCAAISEMFWANIKIYCSAFIVFYYILLFY